MADITIKLKYDITEISEGNNRVKSSFDGLSGNLKAVEASITSLGTAARNTRAAIAGLSEEGGKLKSLAGGGAFSAIAQEAQKAEEKVSVLKQALPEFIGGMMTNLASAYAQPHLDKISKTIDENLSLATKSMDGFSKASESTARKTKKSAGEVTKATKGVGEALSVVGLLGGPVGIAIGAVGIALTVVSLAWDAYEESVRQAEERKRRFLADTVASYEKIKNETAFLGQQKRTVHGLKTDVGDLATQQASLREIYISLNEHSQKRIENIAKEKGLVVATTQVLQSANNANKNLVEGNLRQLIEDAGPAYEKMIAKQKEFAEISEKLNNKDKIEANVKYDHRGEFITKIETKADQIKKLEGQLQSLSKEVGEAEIAFKPYNEGISKQLELYNQLSGKAPITISEFVKMKEAMGLLSNTSGDLVENLEGSTKSFDNVAAKLNEFSAGAAQKYQELSDAGQKFVSILNEKGIDIVKLRDAKIALGAIRKELWDAANDTRYSEQQRKQFMDLFDQLGKDAAKAGQFIGSNLGNSLEQNLDSKKGQAAGPVLGFIRPPSGMVFSLASTVTSWFTGSAVQSIEANKGVVQNRTISLFNVPTGPVQQSGSRVGFGFTTGIDQGLDQNRPDVNGFTSGLFKINFDPFGFGQSIGSRYNAGIRFGMGQSFSGLQTFSVNKFKGFHNTNQQFFKVNSPSLLAAEDIGMPYVEGIEYGMKRQFPSLLRTGNRLAGDSVRMVANTVRDGNPAKIGQGLGESFADGIEKSTPTAVGKAKKFADETVKELKRAKEEFDKLTGLKPEQLLRRAEAAEVQKKTTDVQEIERLRQKLRGQPGVNVYAPLPKEKIDIAQELEKLNKLEKSVEEFQKSLEELEKIPEQMREAKQAQDDELAKQIQAINQAGELEQLRLEEEIELLEAVNELERVQIQHRYELIRLMKELEQNPNIAPADIGNILAERKAQQDKIVEGVKLREQTKDALERKKQADEQLKKEEEDLIRRAQQMQEKLAGVFNNIFQSLLKGGPKAALKTAFGEIKKVFMDEVNKLVSGLAQSLAKFTLKGLFGGAKESAAGEGSGSGGQGGGTGGTGGGITGQAGGLLQQSGIFGKLLGKVPFLKGIFGGGGGAAVKAGAEGANAAGGAAGGLSFAKLGAFFSNPWTAVAIGGAIAGFFILKAIFGDKSIKRLREAIQSTYGIAVKDKNVLKQIKQIGEQQLGKGAASKRPGEVIKLEEAKELIRAHAEATGQKTDKLGASKADYGNENSAVNRQVAPFGGFRELGGIVRAGMAYVVGERRPELFIPQQNGFIQPSFAFAGAGYGGGNAGRGSGGGDGLLALALSQLQETMGRFEAKLQALSPGHVLAMGADENPSVIPDNVLREADSNPGFSDKFLTKTGQKW